MSRQFLIFGLASLCLVVLSCKQSLRSTSSLFPDASPNAQATPYAQQGEPTKAESDVFEFISLEPSYEKRETIKEKFHGWGVLGKTVVTDKKEQARLLMAMNKGIAAAKKAGRGMANCFDPRHGIHIVEKKQTTDYVICFSCGRVEKFVNGVSGDMTVISDSPELQFDAMLTKAGIPLAEKR